MNIRLAAYLDEIHDDPDKAGELLTSKSISNVVLRRAWCRDIYSMPDNAIGILDSILTKRGLTPVLLHTDIGCVKPENLVTEEPKLVRAMQICSYLKCRAIRIGIGLIPADHINTVYPNHIELIHKWLSYASMLSLSYDRSLLLELDYSCYYNQPASVTVLLNKFKRLGLIYDPALLVTRPRVDPFVKFWSLLKSKVGFIDIHDFKTGDSAKPAGFGDAQLDVLIADALVCKFAGWFCLEPNLGRRYGSATTKEETFLCALNAFEALMQRIQLPRIL